MNQSPDALKYQGGPIAKPFPNALPATLYVAVDETIENEILTELAQEFAEEIFAEMEDAFPHYVVSPAIWPTGEKLFQRFMLRIIQAYPTDPVARQNELYAILDTKFVDAYKMGLLPAPLSMPWAFLIKMPHIFKYYQGVFRDLYLRYARKGFE